MIGYTNASSGVSYGEYEDQIELMTQVDTVTFLTGTSNWIAQGGMNGSATTDLAPISIGGDPLSINYTTFFAAISNQLGVYNFTYTNNNWTLFRTTVSLATYGITLNSLDPQEGNEINIVVTRVGPFTQNVTLSRITSDNTPVISVNIPDTIPGYMEKDMMNATPSVTSWSTFATKVGNKSNVYTFKYTNSNWYLQNSAISSAINLTEYGLSVTGTLIEGDNFSVHYSIDEYLEGYGFITKIETTVYNNVGSLLATCYEAEPMMDIKVNVKGV